MNLDVDGRRVHAATGGVPFDHTANDKPVVLLVHGAGMDSTVWQLQTRYLAHRDLRALAVDLPGHGDSEGPPLTSVDDMGAWLVSLLDGLGVDRANVVGHSMGTFVAIDAAAHHPDRINSLTLLGTSTAMPVHPALLDAAANDLAQAAALMAAWGHAPPAHLGLNPTPGLWMRGGAQALVERSRPGALLADFQACVAYDKAEPVARSVTCPTTVIIGLGDKMTAPKGGRALAAAIDGSTTIELANVGHQMMTEAPRQIRAAILATSR